MTSTQNVIGPYEIKEELGRGGTATVHRAIDTRNQQAVALKILLPQFATDSTIMRRFIKEGQLTMRLQHENIVRVYGSGEVDGRYYIAMELVNGCTLSEYLTQRGQVMSVEESIDILSQIAAGLDYAHSLGFLHRDIKLGNVLVANDGRVLLTDFGAAKHMYSDNTLLTAMGHTIGTPSYMSPEQVTGAQIDGRSDVYSLGVIAYKLFTGRLPFRAHSQPELLHKIAYEEPVSPDAINADLPTHVISSLNKTLAKDPILRYESAGALVATLVAGNSWRAKSETLRSLVTKTKDTNKVPVWRGVRRLAIAACVLVASVLVGVSLLTPDTVLRANLAQINNEYLPQFEMPAPAFMSFGDMPLADQTSAMTDTIGGMPNGDDKPWLETTQTWLATTWAETPWVNISRENVVSDEVAGKSIAADRSWQEMVDEWRQQTLAWASSLELPDGLALSSTQVTGSTAQSLSVSQQTNGPKPSMPAIVPRLSPSVNVSAP